MHLGPLTIHCTRKGTRTTYEIMSEDALKEDTTKIEASYLVQNSFIGDNVRMKLDENRLCRVLNVLIGG